MTPETAKRRRAYRSPRRQQQAAETRGVVLDAALLLFSERGWVATGMRDVARESGVSVETVYANFASKSELLMAAIDAAVVGDTTAVPLRERAEFQALSTGSRRHRCMAAARLVTAINERTAGAQLALREAAASDADAARRLRVGEDRRRDDIAEAAAVIAGRPVTDDECDSIWAVSDVSIFRLLTGLRGWSVDHYTEWVADLIGRILSTSANRR